MLLFYLLELHFKIFIREGAIMKLLRIIVFSFIMCGNSKADSGDEFLLYLINVGQMASLHYGFTLDLNSADSSKINKDIFSGIIGVSAGWNVFADKNFYPDPGIPIPFTLQELYFGVRVKYLYMDTYAPTHSVGGMLYIHCKDNYFGVIGVYHFILGAGANFSKIGNLSSNGYYVEIGLGVFKLVPFLINTDITYRANIYSKHNELELGTIHSLNFVWTFF